jgi:ribosome biogenesis GTPase A
MRDIFRKKRSGKSDANVLSQQQTQLLEAELATLERLGAVLEAYPATQDDLDALETAAEQLTSLFLLVVVGEFNSGKSAFLNALIGERVMPEGVTPTTAVINLLQYGETQTERMLPDGIIARAYPAPFWKTSRWSTPPAPTRSSGNTRP